MLTTNGYHLLPCCIYQRYYLLPILIRIIATQSRSQKKYGDNINRNSSYQDEDHNKNNAMSEDNDDDDDVDESEVSDGNAHHRQPVRV